MTIHAFPMQLTWHLTPALKAVSSLHEAAYFHCRQRVRIDLHASTSGTGPYSLRVAAVGLCGSLCTCSADMLCYAVLWLQSPCSRAQDGMLSLNVYDWAELGALCTCL